MASVPAASDREQKIAHLTLHGARFYLYEQQEFMPRIAMHPVVGSAESLRGSPMQNGPWDIGKLADPPDSVYTEAPWSKLQGEQLDSLEWSLIEQFIRLNSLN